MINYIFIYYHLLHFPFLPFTMLLLHHSSQFASWEYLLLLIPLLQTVLFIYSIYSIYYQGNLEMLMDPLDKRELEILSQSITYINKMSNKYLSLCLWDTYGIKHGISLRTLFSLLVAAFHAAQCLRVSTPTERPQGEACPSKSNTWTAVACCP